MPRNQTVHEELRECAEDDCGYSTGGGEVHDTLKNGNDSEMDGDGSLTVDDNSLDDSTAEANSKYPHS